MRMCCARVRINQLIHSVNKTILQPTRKHTTLLLLPSVLQHSNQNSPQMNDSVAATCHFIADGIFKPKFIQTQKQFNLNSILSVV